MIKSKQAEVLACETVKTYLKSCDCKTPQEVANVLMMLTSVCGLCTLQHVGKDEAVARLRGTANFVAKHRLKRKKGAIH